MADKKRPKTELEEELEEEMNEKPAKPKKEKEAKPEKKPSPEKDEKPYMKPQKLPKPAKEKKGGSAAAIIVVLLLLGVLVAVIGFNAFGIRDKYLAGALQNVPLIKNLLPAATSSPEAELSELSKDELAARVLSLENSLQRSTDEIDRLNRKITEYINEITRLEGYEEQQLDYKRDKDEFDRLIALGDPDAYSRFFESIYPDLYEELYKEAIGINISLKELKNYVNAYSSMDPSDTAEIFDVMVDTDLDLVALICRNMLPDARGAILAEMLPINAAAVTKRLAPAEG